MEPGTAGPSQLPLGALPAVNFPLRRRSRRRGVPAAGCQQPGVFRGEVPVDPAGSAVTVPLLSWQAAAAAAASLPVLHPSVGDSCCHQRNWMVPLVLFLYLFYKCQ